MGINLANEALLEDAKGLEQRAALGLLSAAEIAPIAPNQLQPLLAGARARGMADAFDLMGQAVVLVDRMGMALHANKHAVRLFGPDLTLTNRHLVAAPAGQTQALQALIAAALEGSSRLVPVEIAFADGRCLIVEAQPVPGIAGDPCQLLKAVVTIRFGANATLQG